MLTNKPVLDWTPTPTTGSCAFLDRKLPAEIANCITSIKKEKGVHGRERELLMVESGVAYISEGAAPVNVTWKCDQRPDTGRDGFCGSTIAGRPNPSLPPSSSLRPPSSTPGHSPNRPHLPNPTCSFLLFIHREPPPHRHRHLTIASATSSPLPLPSPSHPIPHSVTSPFPFLIAQQALRWPRTPRRFPRVVWAARLC